VFALSLFVPANDVWVNVLTHLSKKKKNTNHQQTHKESFIINRNTLLHVSTVLGHLQGELSVTVTLKLHFIVEWECVLFTVYSVLEACTLCGPGLQAGIAESTRLPKQRSTRQTSMPPLGFEPTIPASARPQTYALDRAATGIGDVIFYVQIIPAADDAICRALKHACRWLTFCLNHGII
jgi:hypothetical protein